MPPTRTPLSRLVRPGPAACCPPPPPLPGGSPNPLPAGQRCPRQDGGAPPRGRAEAGRAARCCPRATRRPPPLTSLGALPGEPGGRCRRRSAARPGEWGSASPRGRWDGWQGGGRRRGAPPAAWGRRGAKRRGAAFCQGPAPLPATGAPPTLRVLPEARRPFVWRGGEAERSAPPRPGPRRPRFLRAPVTPRPSHCRRQRPASARAKTRTAKGGSGDDLRGLPPHRAPSVWAVGTPLRRGRRQRLTARHTQPVR